MKIVCAIDSFKGSLSSMQVSNAVKEGIQKVDPTIQVDIVPLADGGEGTVDALVEGMHGKKQCISVCGPLERKVKSEYGIVKDLAIIEMSAAAGLPLLKEKERNPYQTTTYGVGEIIEDAIEQGCRKFIVGIGGSATNDGGVGMLQALGFHFLNHEGNEIQLGAIGLKDIAKIDEQNADPRLKDCSFYVASDVNNPLCGENGASYIYGPQKGATKEMVLNMDEWMQHYSNITKKYYPNADGTLEGSGAAGGMGFAFHTFLNAKLKSGIDIVLDELKFDEKIKDADFIITGEGRIDHQTSMGKAPIGVAKHAKKYGIPVIALAGCVENAYACNEHGIDAYFPVLQKATTLQEAMETNNAYQNVKDTAEQAVRLIKAVNK